MTHRFPRFALLSGNFITGISVLAPAGMLPQLSDGLGVTVRDAGLLVTYGAILLCIASPVVSWLTSRIGRRLLMTGTLVIAALCHLGSAFADSYGTLLALRLLMLTFIAIYTPQAASTIALIVPEKIRASAIAFVFLGWSLVFVTGLPVITFIASHLGWRETYLVIAAVAATSAALNAFALPNGLRVPPLSLGSFATIARNRTLVLILSITLFLTSGLFLITIYLGPLIAKLADAGPNTIAAFFLLMGVSGFAGNLLTTVAVARFGVSRTLHYAILTLLAGSAIWAFGAGWTFAMATGVFFLGMGLTSANTMQQARLISEAPALASATVALNTSVLYVGQAIGSATGGVLYAQDLYRAIGFASAAFFLIGFCAFLVTERLRKTS